MEPISDLVSVSKVTALDSHSILTPLVKHFLDMSL